ncbi:hypothetical protein QNA08_15850 [Chelatococcus sp. SYSU_G07232]|uniref:Secreted protein n=1 Tax=Chelatococcus albus TaxID=3047466 RepID=A0ABT7AK02_9HYPH|nr:hypothetical protein [Chelatococcus sp. SYSU_G07232]MDJ1159698.1 hypothetical protein [Chelatococcus sp. SYSU_G07232]
MIGLTGHRLLVLLCGAVRARMCRRRPVGFLSRSPQGMIRRDPTRFRSQDDSSAMTGVRLIETTFIAAALRGATAPVTTTKTKTGTTAAKTAG